MGSVVRLPHSDYIDTVRSPGETSVSQDALTTCTACVGWLVTRLNDEIHVSISRMSLPIRSIRAKSNQTSDFDEFDYGDHHDAFRFLKKSSGERSILMS